MDAAESGTALYRGDDRRAGANALARRGTASLAWAAGAFAALVVLSAVTLSAAPAFGEQLWAVALVLWCVLTVAAGVGMLVAWRVGGRAMPARVGTALLAAGALVSLVPRFSSAVGTPAQVTQARPFVVAAVLLAAGFQCGQALRGSVVDSAVRPGRELLRVIAIALVAVLGGRAVLEVLPVHDGSSIRLLPAVAALLAAAWVCGAAGRRLDAVVSLAAFWWVTCAAFFLHTVGSPAAEVIAVSLVATSGVLVARLAWDDVLVALAVHDLRSLRTLASLAEQSDAAQRERERRHDALNAVAAIRSASDVLASRAGDLDAATRAELVAAARAELARVERMLSSSGADAAGAVDLERTLAPVLLSWRRRGLALETRLAGAVVLGAPDVVSRIVDNLLQNAHRHAAGATVRLVVANGPRAVHLDVSDDGPALPLQRGAEPSEARRAPGMRAVGEGVGLASSRRLARELGGDLELLASSGPGWRVRLTLPAVSTARRSTQQLAS